MSASDRDEIEVTPEMIRAAVELLDRLHEPSSEYLAEEVYRAMERARRKPRHDPETAEKS